MKKKKLSTQYDNSAKKYDKLHLVENKKSTSDFFRTMLKHLEETNGLRLLDLGCGSGREFEFYLKKGFQCSGLDTSSEMLALVNKTFPSVTTYCANFQKVKFYQEGVFDVIVSKWAIQTARKIESVYEMVEKLLVSKGYFIFLTVHPIRHFLEKKKSGKNYFKQEVVASEIFNKQITVYEPTHTMQEYLSPYFLEHFELLEIKEDYEFPAAEQIGGGVYPTHLIVVARKK
jgi:ubiquinone/menaquinone biosynthesis C-methylase UbiE